MQRLFVILSAIFTVFIGFSFAAPTVLNYSYSVDGDDVRIFWTNNSNGGNVDINVQDPSTKDRMHYGTVKISDQLFAYTKQRDGEQKIWMVPDDGGDEIQFSIQGSTPSHTVTRTVIPAVPKTGPNGNVIGIILATIAIFGGYIYIKKRADI